MLREGTNCKATGVVLSVIGPDGTAVSSLTSASKMPRPESDDEVDDDDDDGDRTDTSLDGAPTAFFGPPDT